MLLVVFSSTIKVLSSNYTTFKSSNISFFIYIKYILNYKFSRKFPKYLSEHVPLISPDKFSNITA